MEKSAPTAINPTREENYPEWYQKVIQASELAEVSAVRGCMVIRPWGYGIWENIQKILDKKFKDTGHKNAYFPLFIPLSFLEKEAKHVEGFAKECAVVTHHRLEQNAEGKLVPVGELESPLVVRPTSETIIGASFSTWVKSYRDLPLLINQWANVVRWEMRTRLFLRTAEFLWQEGHTCHETSEEAMKETLTMLDVYADFCRDYMAIPVIKGEKTESERFPGAVNTYCIEAMMQDRKALQSGTTHFLGQNFAKASEIKFLGREGQEQFAWTTSWGVSTRLIGAVIMSHADDNGMVVPPRLAPTHVVIIPIIHKEEVKEKVMSYCEKLASTIKELRYAGRDIEVEIDNRDIRGGEKTWSWIKKGVPIYLEVGPRDVDSDSVFMGRRDNADPKARSGIKREEFIATLTDTLQSIQDNLYAKALKHRELHTKLIDSKEEFYKFFTPKNSEQPEIHAGFAFTHFCGDTAVEEQIKKDLNVTVRCIPFDMDQSEGICPFTGKKSLRRVIFAKSY